MNDVVKPNQKESGDKLNGVMKRFCLIFLPLLVLASVITTGFLYQETGVQKKLLLSDQRRNVELLRQLAINDIRSIILDLLFLSVHPNLHQMLENDDPDNRPKLSRIFLDFCKTKALYDQVRLLDETGMELIRVNFNRGQPYIVPEDKLQNKARRYYFADTIKLDPGQIFASPLDLNIERGQIEQPLKPMIRFGTPVADTEGRKRGIVLLNYFGAKMIQALNKASADTIGNCMLLNSEGYWLKGINPEDEWGFMYKDRKDRTLALRNPRAWETITDRDEGQFRDEQGIYTFATVWPLAYGMLSSTGSDQAYKPSGSALTSKGYYWKIVSFIPSEVLSQRTTTLLLHWLPFYGLFVIFLGLVSWYLALTVSRRRQAEEALRWLATTDSLTSINNRRNFLNLAEKEMNRSKRFDRPFSLIMLDIDHFKKVNDTYGHSAGDRVLSEFCSVCLKELRENDIMGRLGGEEFAVVLVESELKTAVIVAERIRKAVSSYTVVDGKEEIRFTVSLGVTGLSANDDLDSMLERADKALYRAKEDGRNQVKSAR